MGKFVRGAVVIVPFPFSDLSATKRRPALVVAELLGDDVILCQVTSQQTRADKYAVAISNTDFVSGRLDVDSFIRPNRIFTADGNIIQRQVGRLHSSKLDEVISVIIQIITGKT